MKEVDKNEAIIERSNRDFSDVKDTVPEPQPKRVLRFIEDYTLAILTMAYLFMIISVIYIYTAISENKLVAFGKAFVGSAFLTMFLYMLLYFLA
jgi:cell division protein FtsL